MTDIKLSDYVKIYDDMNLSEFSDKCIKLFNHNSNMIENHEYDWRRCKIYTNLDSSSLFEEFKTIIKTALNRYRSEVNIGTLSFVNCLEAPNVIKYEPHDPKGPNYFHAHADNWSMETASRQLSIIFYLNDVEEGGDTTFTDLKIGVKPKKGRILIFPSCYLYTHRGDPPISGSKYIIVSWLHFSGSGHAYRVHNL